RADEEWRDRMQLGTLQRRNRYSGAGEIVERQEGSAAAGGSISLEGRSQGLSAGRRTVGESADCGRASRFGDGHELRQPVAVGGVLDEESQDDEAAGLCCARTSRSRDCAIEVGIDGAQIG